MTEDEALIQIADILQVPPDEISRSTARDAVPSWDSLGTLLLIAWVDTNFGVVLTVDEAHALQTIGDILRFLRERKLLD